MRDLEPEIRHDDGSLWEASYRDEASAMSSLFDESQPQYYFREVSRNPRRSWLTFWRPVFVRTGKSWEGSDFRRAGFSLLSDQKPYRPNGDDMRE